MSAATVTREVRWFVLTSAAFLVLWQLAALVGAPRRAAVALGLHGFVFHVAFGKAYALVPSYFDRRLAVAWAPRVHLPFSALGATGLALAAYGVGPAVVATLAAGAWCVGVAVFVAALAWSVRDNLSGRETATSDANADRRAVDRFANAFVPVALAYLAVGSYELLALHASLPTLLVGYPPQVTHLLAAGTGALLVFAVGFRLLPRFLVAAPPRPLVAVVLPAGAVGPLALAATFGDGWPFRVAAAVESVAVVGFAAAYVALFRRSDRRRVGLYGVLAGAASGAVAVLLGLSFAFGHGSAPLVEAHLRATLLGFLGLTVVGVAYQFYPPAIGSFPGASDETALASVALLAGGLVVAVVGLVAGRAPVETAGNALALGGAALYAYLLAGLFRER